ncbi:hypothetical protein, partial [Streptomyces sp. PT12]|uniref:hypothetical protein n=1 Tax=Streptomyces sp. PT12 TaxID=1510197 RepID=UPI001C6729FF
SDIGLCVAQAEPRVSHAPPDLLRLGHRGIPASAAVCGASTWCMMFSVFVLRVAFRTVPPPR